MTEEEKKEFVVRDKRTFSDEKQTEAPEEAAESVSEEEAPTGEPEAADGERAQQADTQMPEINFATFIFSLNSSALFHLGVVEDPSTGKKEKNLALAKQTIDILGMMEEKTRGNLSKDEEHLLKNILTDLRLMFVKESSQ